MLDFDDTSFDFPLREELLGLRIVSERVKVLKGIKRQLE